MKVIQITDFHLLRDEKAKMLNLVNTSETLVDVLSMVKAERPDFVIITGDLSHDGSIESYLRLKTYLAVLPCEIHVIAGNHDHPEYIKLIEQVNIRFTKYYATPYGTFLFVNTVNFADGSGLIDQQELDALEKSLINFEKSILVLHHHFIRLNSLSDKFILQNSEQLLELLNKYKNKIKFCITGHVHNFYQLEYCGLKTYSGYSTCFQYAKTQELLFDFKGPGYTVFNFTKAGYEVIAKNLNSKP